MGFQAPTLVCAGCDLAVTRNKSRAQHLTAAPRSQAELARHVSLNATRSGKYYDSAVGISDGDAVLDLLYF
jgi:hypothetical protein